MPFTLRSSPFTLLPFSLVTCAAILMSGLVTGCKHKVEEPPPKDKNDLVQKEVYTGPGTAETRTAEEPDKKSVLKYVIHWQSTTLRYSKASGIENGDMKSVTGEVYDPDTGKITSVFDAEGGHADRASQTLTLRGNVRFRSLIAPFPGEEPKKTTGAPPNDADKYATTITCDNLIYLYPTHREIIRASGNVLLKSRNSTLGPCPALWATKDLAWVGTPDAFAKRPLK